jgi:methionine-S-sulfoxide reductase
MSADSAGYETAVLAGGCFWGMEEILRKVPGVVETVVGYTGGALAEPKYEDVRSGKTGHAEAIRVKFEPARLSYGALLDLFFRMHDPTAPDRQGNDVGSQYRSAVFFTSPAQEKEAAAAVGRAQSSGLWNKPVVTEIKPFNEFWPAEERHQAYLRKHPDGYTCHYIRKG